MNRHDLLRVKILLFFYALFLSSISLAQMSGTTKWNTTHGVWTANVNGSSMRGPYSSDNGRIVGTLNGTTFTGFWAEKSSAYKCASPRDGSFYWGPITLRFDADFKGFKGTWEYCGGQGSGGLWNGTRVGGLPSGMTSAPAACDVTALQKLAHEKTTALLSAQKKLEQFESAYLDFYENSKVQMSADFPKVYHDVPNVVPFSGSVNAALSNVVKIEKREYIRHKPDIKITRNTRFNSAIDTFLVVSKDLATALGGAAGVLAYASDVSDWKQYLFGDLNSKSYPMEEGLERFKLMMNQRSKVLDVYRKDISEYFCKNVLAGEKEIFEFRTQSLPGLGCAANELAAIEGWFTRGTQFNNQTTIDRMSDLCNVNQP